MGHLDRHAVLADLGGAEGSYAGWYRYVDMLGFRAHFAPNRTATPDLRHFGIWWVKLPLVTGFRFGLVGVHQFGFSSGVLSKKLYVVVGYLAYGSGHCCTAVVA